jgi:hypothetical protein
MRIKLLLLLLLITVFLLSNKSFSQNTKTEMAVYNIGINSVFSGIGALINKKPNEKWHKVLLKGMGQGAFGGYLIYESKNLIGNISNKKSWEYSWYGKFVNSAGTSIIENASSNRNFWEKWHINFGFNRVEFHTKGKFKIKYRIMPISLILTASAFVNSDARFEFKRTIQTGEFIFSTDNPKYESGASTFGNIIVFTNDRLNDYSLFSHEIIHIYQYYDYNYVNTYFNKPFERLQNNSNTFKSLNKIFHWDLQAPILRGLYLYENLNRNCYYDNFFENEAGFYSNTIICN